MNDETKHSCIPADTPLPINQHFIGIACAVCGKPYGPDFTRNCDEGIPVYYKWQETRPLDPDEMLSAIFGQLKVNWFCSAKCSNQQATLPSKVENENQPISVLEQKGFAQYQDPALPLRQLSAFPLRGKLAHPRKSWK